MDTYSEIVRPAQPQDAGSISAIYRTIYGCEDAERIGANYPYPQFMDARWIENAINQNRILWLVSKANGSITGAIASVPNIGSERDKIAESFGLVVGRRWQGKGLGKKLIAAVGDTLGDRAAVMIGETRTADPAAYRVINSAGWLPFGFEPFAHRMPTGAEPMILMGLVSEDAMRDRSLSERLSPAVVPLAEAVLSQLDARAPTSTDALGYPVTPTSWAQLKKLIMVAETDTQRTLDQTLIEDESFCLRTDNDPESGFGPEPAETVSHASGIVELDHMRAEDPMGKRVIEMHLTGCFGETPVASAYLVWDLRDKRVRINALATGIEGLQGIMLSQVFSWLDKERRARESPLCVIVDVRADRPELQVTLERLGCFPTAYYPSFVAGDSARHDAVQYTKLYGQRFDDCLEWIRDLDLGEGDRVIEATTHGAARAPP